MLAISEDSATIDIGANEPETPSVRAASAAPGTRARRWALTLLGVVLLAQGVGKLLNVGGYIAALGAFDLLPVAATGPLVLVWLAVEISAGVGLLVAGLAKQPPRPLSFIAAALGALTAVGYAVLTIQAYVRGIEVANCTCFGVYLAQRLSWFVLLQDAYMLLYTGLMLKKTHAWLST